MPKWLDTAIFYEIYPQSFLDTNADGIRFLLDGTPGMPLVYERLCEQEQLLIVLNPGKEAVSFPYDKTLGKAVYTFGSPALQENGTVTAAPVFAGIYKIR